MSNRKNVVFSFFAGVGMLDMGFEKEGYDIVFVNEVKASFLKAYQYARLHMKGYEAPRYGYHETTIDTFLDKEKTLLCNFVDREKVNGSTIGFIGGPPCPDFSVGGKNRGRDGDNGRLSKSYTELIIKNKPHWFVFENVKGLWKTKRHREFFEELKADFRNAGYVISDQLLNSIEFGVPQNRDRIFIVGVLKEYLKEMGHDELIEGQKLKMDWRRNAKYPYKQAFEEYEWPTKTKYVEEGDIPVPNNIAPELSVEYWFRKNKVDVHPNSKHAFKPRAGLKHFKSIPEGDDKKKSYKRLHRWRYSPTAAYGNNEVHIHPYRPRRLSAAEALAIQSMPKEFTFSEDMSLSDMFKTIGNGVPYLLGRNIAKLIKDFS